MDVSLINNWNSEVAPDDTVIHLGDFVFGNEAYTKSILDRLVGKIVFLPGNHDTIFWKHPKLIDRFENAAQLYQIVRRHDNAKFNMSMEIPYSTQLSPRGLIVLQHYCGLVWNKSHHGSLMLHGHSHGSLRYPKPMRALDVGVDPMGYSPIRLSEVVNRLEKIDPPTFDHHGED
jgi:calcineurin-like phosphoesterase family protein